MVWQAVFTAYMGVASPLFSLAAGIILQAEPCGRPDLFTSHERHAVAFKLQQEAEQQDCYGLEL